MNNLFYPKKSNYCCAWCFSNNTFIISPNNKPKSPFKPKSPYIPYDDRPSFTKRIRQGSYNEFSLDDERPSFTKRIRQENYNILDDDYLNVPVPFPYPRIMKHNPYNFLIHCNDCTKDSNVKLQKCRICNIDNIIITRSYHLTGPFTDPFTDHQINPDYIFNENIFENNYICKTCLLHPPILPCEHNGIKPVNDLKSES
jgi:hypothetical protein